MLRLHLGRGHHLGRRGPLFFRRRHRSDGGGRGDLFGSRSRGRGGRRGRCGLGHGFGDRRRLRGVLDVCRSHRSDWHLWCGHLDGGRRRLLRGGLGLGLGRSGRRCGLVRGALGRCLLRRRVLLRSSLLLRRSLLHRLHRLWLFWLLVAGQAVALGPAPHHVGVGLGERGRVALHVADAELAAEVDDLSVRHPELFRELVHAHVLRHSAFSPSSLRRAGGARRPAILAADL